MMKRIKALIGSFRYLLDDAQGSRARALVRLVVLIGGRFGLQLDDATVLDTMIALELVLAGGVASPIGDKP